jgi:hypothetical protein
MASLNYIVAVIPFFLYFALLRLRKTDNPPITITNRSDKVFFDDSSTDQETSPLNIVNLYVNDYLLWGLFAAGIVASLLIIIAAVVYCYKRRRERKYSENAIELGTTLADKMDQSH